MKKPTKTRLTIQIATSEADAFARERAAVEKSKAVARKYADEIESGRLPESLNERGFIAAILRGWADRVKAPKPVRRGNPSFARKIYDPDYVALYIGHLIASGVDRQEATAQVADEIGVDNSTVEKLFRERREAVARWFAKPDLAARVGAILGK